MKIHDLANKYRQNLVSFINLIKNILDICIEEDVTSLSSVIVDEFKERLEKADLVEKGVILKFIEVSYSTPGLKESFLVWKKIKARQEVFFKENILLLVEDEYKNKIKPYIDLIDAVDRDGDLIVDDEYRKVIWDYCDSFVVLAIKYLHAARKPALKKTEETGALKKIYTISVLPEITNKEFLQMAKLFNVKLEW